MHGSGFTFTLSYPHMRMLRISNITEAESKIFMRCNLNFLLIGMRNVSVYLRLR